VDPSRSSDLGRAFAFQRWVLESTSTRTEQTAWGTAFFHDDFPLKYDANMALIDRPLGGITLGQVDADMERLYGGFRHREIEIASDTDADRLAMGLAERGYSVERMVVMVHRRDPDHPGQIDIVEEVSEGASRSLHMEISRREPWGGEPGITEVMADHRRAVVDAVGARIFAQRIEGGYVGSCELYLLGDVAQVEDVGTLEEFRGNGVARNVVLRAVHEARQAGARFVFLFADADDWPRQFYRRLGFDEVGRSCLFTRLPEGEKRNAAKSQDG
jgi:ribosomal protein S18 acetylase RimI-like enzyme